MFRHFLFFGGLPENLVASARLMCAYKGPELEAALSAAQGREQPKSVDSPQQAFDWSKVDWEAEDPFAACQPQHNLWVAGQDCECRTLRGLTDLLRCRLSCLPKPADTTGRDERHAVQVALAASYVSGQRVLLEEALAQLQRLTSSAEGMTEDMERPPKRRRSTDAT